MEATGDMGKVIADQSISLDGFTTGLNVSVANPLGDDGERLHQWMNSNPTNVTVSGEPFQTAGAFIVGRRMFDVGVGPWGDDPPFHAPVFVVTHRTHERLSKAGGTTYHFATGGLDDALARARAAAGQRDVIVFGGANTIGQLLEARLLDELRIHLLPVLLGNGTRLFEGAKLAPTELVRTRVVTAPDVTHFTFRVPR